MITAIFTGLFFGGVFYICFGLYHEQKFIKEQIKSFKEMQKQQRAIEQKQKEAEKEFDKKWEQLRSKKWKK